MGTATNRAQEQEDACSAGMLLTREQLKRRWRHGSDSFFWRAEADGLLIPVRHGREVRYRWPDVFRFEGGLPPEGWEEVYQADLMRPEQVAQQVGWKRETIIDKAKDGLLPCRRVGAKYRFVPAEVARWMAQWT